MATAKKTRKPRKKAAASSAASPRRRRRLRRTGKEAQLAFEAIAIEGGLLSPDWLARAAQLEAGGQAEADYRIPKGLNLRDEIGRYWRIAQALWAELVSGRQAAGEDENKNRALAERFVTTLLRDCFGFASITKVESAELDGRLYPVGHAALDGRVPIVIAPAGAGLDAVSLAFGDGARRRSAFGLCQEFLNAEERTLWGLASDGVSLRILRDNASLTRPAWIEADLGRIFTEERYADFAALWLLVHETRFGRPGQPVTECSLEAWREAGREEGTRARDQLRHGVEEALATLGHGFLAHADNQSLRAALSSGALTKEAYFQELLRLAYRLIFLLTVEERGVLHPDTSDEAARKLYGEGYSLRRLRERAVKRSAHDRHHDHWETVKIAFRGLATGEPRLALPALAGIFAKDQCPTLDAARLENRFLLLALFRLSWLREEAGLARVNWRDMGPEELGSVYESLLELVPQITEGGRAFSFATGAETKGHARKTTGSYYTPDSLVQVLLDSALEPVVERTIAEHPSDPVEAVLSLSIVDPACGSGHFLLAAARRLAAHVARLQADGTPSAAEYRHALRQVVGRCIYGVDLNPMAVELCKVSLWMEAVEPGLPLTFLDSHIRHGNALLGTTPELMAKGIPDDAWKPIEGDDKKVASALRKRNKDAMAGQRGLDTLWSKPKVDEAEELSRAIAALESASDTDVTALAEKKSRWQELLDSKAYQHQKLIADAWCAAFVWPKQPGPLAEAAPTNELWRQTRDGQGHPPELTVKTVNELSDQYTFFHWHSAFPHVFARGGFDVVLGNPPWDQIQLDAREWFAARNPEVASAQHHAARQEALEDLRQEDPELYASFASAQRQNEGTQSFVHLSGRFPLGSSGRVNTSTLFVEAGFAFVSESGFVALVVPTGLATDSFTQEFFRHLVESGRLHQLLAFENEERLFPAVHNAARFCLLKISGKGIRATEVQLVFYARQVEHVRDPARLVLLGRDDFRALNPNTATCPTFRWRRDADLNRSIYRSNGVFVCDDTDGGNPWGFAGLLMFMMNTDSHRFRTESQMDASGCRKEGNQYVGATDRYLPLYEGKMIYHFDHRFGTYEGATQAHLNKKFLPQFTDDDHCDPARSVLPQYWVPAVDVQERVEGRWNRGWLLGWRDITGVEKQRTVVPAIIPVTAVGHTMPLLLTTATIYEIVGLYGNLSSFILDYTARQKVGGTHLTYSYLKQLPVLPPKRYASTTAWHHGLSLQDWLLPRILELTYTAWDLEPFGCDVGYDGPPFRWDPERRFLLRAELDAAFFHLYGIERDDVDYIMETFPIVRKNDEKAHGEYRTKRVVLEIYGEMAEAARSGKPYQTRLSPPPADPLVAHPAREGGQVIPLPVRPATARQLAVAAQVPDLAAVGANAWVRPHTMERGEVQAAIVAVLKANGAPMDRRQARLASLLCLEPHLLASMLDRAENAQWARVVGGDAKKAASASIDTTSQEWGAALTGLRGRERLLEDLQQNTWALGTGTEAIDTSGWPEGRAGFVVNVLRRLQQSTQVDAIILKLPTNVQQWLANAA